MFPLKGLRKFLNRKFHVLGTPSLRESRIGGHSITRTGLKGEPGSGAPRASWRGHEKAFDGGFCSLGDMGCGDCELRAKTGRETGGRIERRRCGIAILERGKGNF